jgi:hypothetical protein
MFRDMTEFESLSWHDCHIWGLGLRVGSPDEDDWTCDLVLDIDFIVEWICGTSGGAQFRVAPATLTFHHVTDARIAIDWGDTGGQVSMHLISIDRIERTVAVGQKVHFDRAYYRWSIHNNWPTGGLISFCATSFTQTLRADPLLTDTQCLTLTTRRPPDRR